MQKYKNLSTDNYTLLVKQFIYRLKYFDNYLKERKEINIPPHAAAWSAHL